MSSFEDYWTAITIFMGLLGSCTWHEKYDIWMLWDLPIPSCKE